MQIFDVLRSSTYKFGCAEWGNEAPSIDKTFENGKSSNGSALSLHDMNVSLWRGKHREYIDGAFCSIVQSSLVYEFAHCLLHY